MKTLATVMVVLTISTLALAGAGNDQPTNLTVTTPVLGNYNEANICWHTNNASDSLVMIGNAAAGNSFSRQVYINQQVTSHCVLVTNLEPGQTYSYSVASCTTSHMSGQCARTDTNWSSAPFPGSSNPFTTGTPSGAAAFSAIPWGANYVYQGNGINVGVTIIQTGGTPTSSDALVVTAADIDGYSCLPGHLLGSTCHNITVSLLCNGPEVQGGASTNNYPVYL
jgi:hypothetical protein